MPVPELEDLRAKLVGYGRFVEAMIGKSRRALRERQAHVLKEIIDADEPRANDTEISLEAECTSVIARHQPMARDLRAILMILRIVNDLERIADHAVNIAEAVRDHINGTDRAPDDAVLVMFEKAMRMMDDAILAFIDRDPGLAQQVCLADAEVDSLATGILERMSAAMTGDPSRIPHNLALLKIAANLERVADLSTNMGEDVIYMAEGRVIKHHRQEGMPS
jgi:phosphate transport system protein